MERPISIVWFERCYLGSLVVGLLNTALMWNVISAKTTAQLESNPAAAQFGPSFVAASMGFGVLLVIICSLLLWYFTARKASVVTKWIVTVLFAYNLVTFLFRTVAGGGALGPVAGVLMVAALVLNGLAVWQLFKPDARAWFGELKA